MTALLDDAAERLRQIRESYDKWRGDTPYWPADHAVFMAGWQAATEAAALKSRAEIESLRRILREHAIHEFPDDQMVQCAECGNVWRKGFPEDHGFSVPEEELCAAAIRGGKL